MLDLLHQIDRDLLIAVNRHHSPLLDNLMWFVSGTWSWLPFYFLLAGCILYRYKKKGAIMILLIALLVILSDQIASGIIKPWVHRLRPSHQPGVQEILHYVNGYRGGMYGFVSSHACNVFALAFYLHFAAAEKIKWLSWVLFPWAVLVSYSRVYLGVHYPSDVIVPVFISLPIAGLVYWLYKKIITGLRI